MGQLKKEPPAEAEIAGLRRSGEARLADAQNPELSLESRFDLAYNAAHALALAALRFHGYRSRSRYVIFQVLPHILGLSAATWRVLAKCHDARSTAEYEGAIDLDDRADGAWTVIDFKTARLADSAQAATQYRDQLDGYSTALAPLTGESVAGFPLPCPNGRAGVHLSVYNRRCERLAT